MATNYFVFFGVDHVLAHRETRLSYNPSLLEIFDGSYIQGLINEPPFILQYSMPATTALSTPRIDLQPRDKK